MPKDLCHQCKRLIIPNNEVKLELNGVDLHYYKNGIPVSHKGKSMGWWYFCSKCAANQIKLTNTLNSWNTIIRASIVWTVPEVCDSVIKDLIDELIENYDTPTLKIK